MENSAKKSTVEFNPELDVSKDDINAYLDSQDRTSIYDFKDDETAFYKLDSGLTEEIVNKISEEKHDPEWMHEFRLKSLDLYNKIQVPQWGSPIDGLNMDNIVTYVRPNTDMKTSWDEVPEEIKSAFDKLGIPQAEHDYLAGVGAQYDSELVYHNLQESVAAKGVVYSDLESAMTGEYADMVKEYFMKLVPPTDHKFAALHGAVWSGGSFVYVPKGVTVEVPLQSYFRLNAKGAGQFEHTLIIVDEGADLHFIEGCSAPKWNVANLHAGCVELYVKKNARLRYSTIENWSKNMYNLNTKRALVEEGARMEWVSGSFGSHVSYLYPTTILKGKDSQCDYTGITFSGKGQNLDTGCRMVHLGENTSSLVTAKSLSKDGGINTFRSSIEVMPSATGSKSSVDCSSLMLDDISRSDTIPEIDVRTADCNIGHEAKIGRISDDAVFYLMSRGISEEEARSMIVSGFANPISKELPLEYAAEMNNLIKLEMEGA
ncbi:MAG: Fe-S cluster assembly protein SufB [Lachnospiraceae bacterium]|nr:Fe-S cluster assembly protein SufB [Lachnospiraceae bacterium]